MLFECLKCVMSRSSNYILYSYILLQLYSPSATPLHQLGIFQTHFVNNPKCVESSNILVLLLNTGTKNIFQSRKSNSIEHI